MFKLKDYFTAGSLLVSLGAVILAFQGRIPLASFLVFVAWGFDALDGLVARLTRTRNEFGAQFDDLVDHIAYTVAPGFIVYAALGPRAWWVGLAGCFAVILLGTVRLAVANTLSLRYPGFWIGVPRPASGFLIVFVLNARLFSGGRLIALQAALIVGMHFPEPHAEGGRAFHVRELVDFSPILAGIRYVRSHVRLRATVLVKAGGRLWALPAPMVEQVQQIKDKELINLYLTREVSWQNRKYPFFYLPRLLGDPGHNPETLRYNPVLLLKSGHNTAAVHVDEMRCRRRDGGTSLLEITKVKVAEVLQDASFAWERGTSTDPIGKCAPHRRTGVKGAEHLDRFDRRARELGCDVVGDTGEAQHVDVPVEAGPVAGHQAVRGLVGPHVEGLELGALEEVPRDLGDSLDVNRIALDTKLLLADSPGAELQTAAAVRTYFISGLNPIL